MKAVLPDFRVVTGVMIVAHSAILSIVHTFGLRQREVVRKRGRDKRISN